MYLINFEPIGIIYTPFKRKEDCPIQPMYSEDASGKVEVFPKYAVGLKDIEGFSHIYLLYLFDRSGEIKLVRPTFLDDEPRGIFATRHPCRPNPLGLSIVRLEGKNDNILIVKGIDVLDATLLLDIKPYIPKYDAFPNVQEGWAEGKTWRPNRKGGSKMEIMICNLIANLHGICAMVLKKSLEN